MIATSDNLLEKRLDPFSSEVVSEEHIKFTNKIMEEIFVEFHDHVLRHRGDKIAPESKD